VILGLAHEEYYWTVTLPEISMTGINGPDGK